MVKKFHKLLQEERFRLGLNQSEFSKIGGMSLKTQVLYEKGERHPDSLYLSKLYEYGVDVPYLFTGHKPNGSNKPIEPNKQHLKTLDQYVDVGSSYQQSTSCSTDIYRPQTLFPVLSWKEAIVWENILPTAKTEPDRRKMVCVDEPTEDMYILEVNSASMRPRFSTGQFIWIEPRQALTDGCFAILDVGEPLPVFRKITIENDAIWYSSINQHFPDSQTLKPLPVSGRSLGVVVFHGEIDPM